MEYGTKLIINSVVRGTTDVIKIDTISNIGSKIKSKMVKNSNIK